jgi:Ca2+-binding RTX toxin-like protein
LGADTLDGGDGFDYADYRNATGPLTVSLANPGNNTGEAAGDTYTSIEAVQGSAFDDVLIGDGNDNFLRGGLGADTLNGGDGVDSADYHNATAGLTVSLANPNVNTGEAVGDTYVSIEGIQGSAFDDVLIGDDGNNRLRGREGADSLSGGGGTDFADYRGASEGVTANLANPSVNTGDAAGDTYTSIEGLIGTNFDDVLIGDGGNNNLRGGLGADTLNGGGGFDFASYDGNTTDELTGAVVASLANPASNTGAAAGDTYVSIEGLIGSDLGDTLTGDGNNNGFRGNLGNDTINGGDGIDTAIFSGNRASYTLTDLGGGSVRVVGADGTDTLNSIEKLQFADQTITWGQTVHPESDFGGDGISDILWRSNTGQIAVWQLDNTGHVTAAQGAGALASSWHVEDTGDFNNDGNADILWRNDSGQIALWTMDGSHVTSATSLGTLASSWEIQGAVDFNGDGTSDILWRNSTNGNVVVWNTDGAGHVTSTTNLGIVNNAYHIQALDDFNGDGTDDILWRNDNGQVALWQMNGSGVSSAGTVSTLATTWHIQESGDFNGDGKADILWRSDAGQIAIWSMDGAHATNAASIGTLSNAWQVETTGDYNGDGKDDILWQNTTTGQAVEWLMNGSQVVGTVDLGKLPAWDVQHHDFDIV